MPKMWKTPPNPDAIDRGIVSQKWSNNLVDEIFSDNWRYWIKGSGSRELRKLPPQEKGIRLTALIQNSSDEKVRQEAKAGLKKLNTKYNLGINIDNISEGNSYVCGLALTSTAPNNGNITPNQWKSKNVSSKTKSKEEILMRQTINYILDIGRSTFDEQVSGAAYEVLSWIKDTHNLDFNLPDFSVHDQPKKRPFSFASKQKSIQDIREVLIQAKLDDDYTKNTKKIKKQQKD